MKSKNLMACLLALVAVSCQTGGDVQPIVIDLSGAKTPAATATPTPAPAATPTPAPAPAPPAPAAPPAPPAPGAIAYAASPPTDHMDLARRYLAAREASMQEGAGSLQVEAVLALCSESVVYEHPRVGIKMSGLDAMRSGMTSFLGASRNTRIKTTANLPGRDMIAAQTQVSFEGKDGAKWTAVHRQQVWVFEFKDKKITRIIEYW